MRIAQVSPLFESVPPRSYGGTERVVAYLADALMELGHDVTLFASGDSQTRARLVAACPRALRPAGAEEDATRCTVIQLDEVYRRAVRFDILHVHLDYAHLPLARRCPTPTLTTLHGRLDLPGLGEVYTRFRELPLVSISAAQRAPLPRATWLGTVHHGLPLGLYEPGNGEGGYVAFVGRMCPEKRPDRAIRIARAAGAPLRIAAKVDRADRAYFDEVVRPLLRGPGVEWVGEIGEADKQAFLGGARAVLFPIDWPEPFGLVMIEALACGTPVIAYRQGSVPEILEDGETGFVVSSEEEAVAALGRIETIDRRTCRRVFEERFAASRMARDYVALYEELARRRRGTLRIA